MLGKALLVLCCCTALSTYTSCTIVALPVLEPFILTRHLLMWCCGLNGEVLESAPCDCIQTYIATEIWCLYQEVEKTFRGWARETLPVRDISVTNTLNLHLALCWSTIHDQIPLTRKTTVHESNGTETYSVVLIFQPIKVFCINQYQLKYITAQSLATWKSTGR